jgi:Polyketide cyclase / dehydrase and lipid transport
LRAIDIRLEVEAPAAVVCAQLIDAVSWVERAGYDEVEVEQESERGELRRHRSGETVIRELVRRDDDGRRLEYEHVSGLPVVRDTGAIAVAPRNDAAELRWQAQVDPPRQNAETIVHVVRSVIEELADGPVATAEALWRRAGIRAVGGDKARYDNLQRHRPAV